MKNSLESKSKLSVVSDQLSGLAFQELNPLALLYLLHKEIVTILIAHAMPLSVRMKFL